MRIGYVSYLNTLPLICDLEQLLPAAGWLAAPPSVLAAELAAGRLDVALAPVAEWFRRPEWRVVSDAAIVADGAVRSVALFAKRDVAEVETVLLDPHSRTSNALLRVLLRERLPREPEYFMPPADSSARPSTPEALDADACLAIGDRALRMEGRFPHVLDLGQAWAELTGLPFVFACWLGRAEAIDGSLADALNEARDRGLTRLEELADAGAARLELPPALCRDYLRHRIKFQLTDSAREGLERFRQLWTALPPSASRLAESS